MFYLIDEFKYVLFFVICTPTVNIELLVCSLLYLTYDEIITTLPCFLLAGEVKKRVSWSSYK